jgi:hypothetical protein
MLTLAMIANIANSTTQSNPDAYPIDGSLFAFRSVIEDVPTPAQPDER